MFSPAPAHIRVKIRPGSPANPRTGHPFFFHKLLTLLLLGIVLVFGGCEISAQNEAASNEKVSAGGYSSSAERRLDPDSELNSISYDDLLNSTGIIFKPAKNYKLAALLRFLGNPYCQLIMEGMRAKAKELGITIDFQAGANESDQAGQYSALESMIDKGYDAILVSPLTDLNLESAVAKAKRKHVLLINVDAAIISEVLYYVGPNQYENGARAAKYLMEKLPGGEVAILKGQNEDYGVNRRVRGFTETLGGSSFKIGADPQCASDLQVAFQYASEIIEERPGLVCIYCTSDVMALGAFQAVKFAGKSDRVMVIGRDGIPDAIESIRSGGLSSTVDTFPLEIGRIAVDVAVRILDGKQVPTVVRTSQSLVAGNGPSD